MDGRQQLGQPRRFVIAGDRCGDLGLERVEAVAHRGDGGQGQTTAFGLQGLDQLPAAGRQGAQQIVANHAAAPAAPAQLVGEEGEDQPGILLRAGHPGLQDMDARNKSGQDDRGGPRGILNAI